MLSGTIRIVITVAVVLLVLRYTGLLSGASAITGAALMKTGVMDVDPESLPDAKPFEFDFSVQDLDGKKVDVASFKGKVIFLNLWATWCGPCRVEMPSIQKLYDKVDHDSVAFLMLSLDSDNNHAKVVNYVQKEGFTFPVYRPYQGLPEQLRRVTTIPTTFIIGADGRIKWKQSGTANYDTEEFKQYLEGLIPRGAPAESN